MGASTSVSSRIINNIYVSYSLKDRFAIYLHEELMLRNSCNYFGPIEVIEKEYSLSNDQVSQTIKNIMSNSRCIIIYISRETVASYFQAVEINHAGHSNATVIYIMTDETYTPDNTSFLRQFIENHEWFPAYDDETLDDTLEKLVDLLK